MSDHSVNQDDRLADLYAASTPTPDPARLAAEEVCAMFGPAWVKYTYAGLPVGRVADIIRKHYADTVAKKDAEIERLRKAVEAADAMRSALNPHICEANLQVCTSNECASARSFDAARKELP